jgi:uncharacterized protein (TIGR02246 family)
MKRASLICLLLVAGGPIFGQGRTDPALNQLAAAFAAAFNEQDAVKVAAFYTEDAVLMPPNMAMVKGRRDIEAYYRKGFSQSGGTMKLNPFESSIAGTLAIEAGGSTMSGTVGGAARTDAGKYVVIYRRVKNEWKIAFDIFNNDAPPAR